MKQTINQTQFIDAFQNRITYKDNFSYDGLVVLYEYFDRYEEEAGEEMELDVIAICCEYSEMDTTELLQAYNPLTISNDEFNELSEDVQVKAIEEYLYNETSYIGYTDDKTFIFAQW